MSFLSIVVSPFTVGRSAHAAFYRAITEQPLRREFREPDLLGREAVRKLIAPSRDKADPSELEHGQPFPIRDPNDDHAVITRDDNPELPLVATVERMPAEREDPSHEAPLF